MYAIRSYYGFHPVQELIHPGLQTGVFVHQCLADEHPGHAPVFLREGQQQLGHGPHLLNSLGFFRVDAVDEAEQGLFDELDEVV